MAKFSIELFDAICNQIATSSKSLRSICKEHGAAPSTFFKWVQDDKILLDKYTRAREQQADYLADEIIEISDHSEEDHTAFTGANVVNRDRLRVEARKWVASKLKPKKYGDKVEVDNNITVSNLPDWLVGDINHEPKS
jgi:transposase-like protein